eukprot:TRINITY_DN10622_c0_g1_i2.p1 TRINITY_DN10622_c0_g1~~TRINITY_DN10622_c0_g1_i2.p1  ORF type:complete len:146 (+),score=35.92 TRINITY_DN10622_c0_g1_i2:115-552(+)
MKRKRETEPSPGTPNTPTPIIKKKKKTIPSSMKRARINSCIINDEFNFTTKDRSVNKKFQRKNNFIRSTSRRKFIYRETIGEKLFPNAALANGMMDYLNVNPYVENTGGNDGEYVTAMALWMDNDKASKEKKLKDLAEKNLVEKG